jgi:hypothetical protein
MQANIINYYEKVTDLALKNLAQEKQFRFKSKLNNPVMLMQSEDELIKKFKQASGGKPLTKEAENLINGYKEAVKGMNKLAVKDYNETLRKLKAAQSIEDKQKILYDLADRGFRGFKAKNGANWNIETYTNMYYTHLNNEMVRLGALDGIKADKVQISSHHTLCDLCKNYEGKIMDRSEVENARANGLFHPNCRHTILEVS